MAANGFATAISAVRELVFSTRSAANLGYRAWFDTLVANDIGGDVNVVQNSWIIDFDRR